MILWIINLGFGGSDAVVSIWTAQADVSTTWTAQTDVSTTWTIQ